MTQQRSNIALRAINPSFRLDNDAEINYTLPLDKSQQTLVQQTVARKATPEATVNREQRRFNCISSNSGSPSTGSKLSFFSIRYTLTAGWFQQQQQLKEQYQNQQQQQTSTKQPQEKHQPFSSVESTTTITTSSPVQLNDTTSDPVGGRLSKYFKQWTNITNNSFVINTVQHGYHISFNKGYVLDCFHLKVGSSRYGLSLFKLKTGRTPPFFIELTNIKL
ncbi:hypothetical protein BD408DRAFT_437464 [Parasitella parasitica]|nr:hypothetical protein BD408DRAFT_437464 [Parasitella parasitica]